MSLFGSTGHVAQVQLDLLKIGRDVGYSRASTYCPDTDTAGIIIGHSGIPTDAFAPLGMEALTCKGSLGCGVVRSFLLVRARYCGGCWYGISSSTSSCSSCPQQSPLVPPGMEGGGHGGRFIRSPCLCLTPYNRQCPFGPRTVAVHGAPSHNRWGVVETTLSVETQGRTKDCLLIFVYWVLLQSVIQVSLRKVQQGPAVTSVITSPSSRNGALRQVELPQQNV